jgi:hypothetical protein
MVAAVATTAPARNLAWMGVTPPESYSGQSRICALLCCAAFFAAGSVHGDPLPTKAPRPAPREPAAQQIVPTPPSAAPLPDPRPAVSPSEQPVQTPPKTDEKPSPRPQLEQPARVDETDEHPAEKSNEKKADTPPAFESPPRPETSPAEEAACRKRLTALGAKFDERPPLNDPSGCALPRPVALDALGGGIGIEPEALVNCATAEAIARFSTNIVSKIARQELGSDLKSIQQASGYVCRPRNGTHKLSEHAFGNALDIASFTLSNGATVEVNATRNPKHSLFLSKVRTAACGPFKTVLGPGSDADHAAHFHLDLAKRRNGSTFCQ